MHKLYYVEYTIKDEDIGSDLFADEYLFTEEEPSAHVCTYHTFQSFFNDIKLHKYPWHIPGSNYNYHEPKGRIFKPCIIIYGVHCDYEITEKNFKDPLSIEVTYTECSPKNYNLDFFKKHLSMDDFMTFLQEHYGSNPVIQTLLTEKQL